MVRDMPVPVFWVIVLLLVLLTMFYTWEGITLLREEWRGRKDRD